jgi:uncharacterized radical SAM superfamily Fe-S cluster-containing enzyme
VSHPDPRNVGDFTALVDQVLAVLKSHHTPESAVYRTILTVQKATLAFVAGNQQKLIKLEKAMDVTGFTPIVQKLNETAVSLAASAQAIGAGATAAQADQQQLNAALAAMGTAVDGVASAAKAIADAVSPPGPAAPPVPHPEPVPVPQ